MYVRTDVDDVMAIKPNFLTSMGYHIFLTMVLRARAPSARAELRYDKVPVQAKGAWVTRPVNNWAKATTLLANLEKSEWHLAAVERRAFSQSAEKRNDVIELIVTASEKEKKENRKMKKLIRSLYFLAKHHIPHTTTFEGLVTLQIENGDITLKVHTETSPRNATYESYSTIVELLTSISKTLENSLLESLKGSVYYSIMVDESTDIAS